MMLWVGCIAGALDQDDYQSKLVAAGFANVSFETTRVYNIEDARQFLSTSGIDLDAVAAQVEGKFLSAFIRATKPESSCCQPGCCTPTTATLKG
jgi:stage V sporulation protein SpoVS